MKVYLPHPKARRQPVFVMCTAPAALVRNQEIPLRWLDEKGNPAQINVEFKFGEAEVEDGLARLLLEHKLVQKSTLILTQDQIRAMDTHADPDAPELDLSIQGG